MKIIGETKDGFILEASKDEVYNLIGYYSKYSENKRNIYIGDSIKVSEMYQQLYKLSSSKKYVNETIKTLISIAEELKSFDPVVKQDDEQGV